MTVLSLWVAEGEPNVSLNLHDSDQDTVSCHSLEKGSLFIQHRWTGTTGVVMSVS